jgi:hypothetical protein
MFGKLFSRLFRKTTVLSPVRHDPRRRSMRLGLESLEAREVPAVVMWSGAVSDDFNNALNWDVLNSRPLHHKVPEAGDDIVFSGLYVLDRHSAGGAGIQDCVGLKPDASGAYNSLLMLESYEGTVTVAGGFDTRVFQLAGGTIDQPVASSPFADTDIAVIGDETIDPNNSLLLTGLPADFVWTGGDLNSTSTLSTLTIDGATAEFAPANAGAVSTGNNISLVNGAAAEFKVGEFNFTNNGVLTIGALCTAQVKPVTVTSTVKYVGVKQINIDADGFFAVGGPGIFDGTGVPLYNSGGGFSIYDFATVKLGGKVKVGLQEYQSSFYQDGTGAYSLLESGSNLQVEKTAFITAGSFKTAYTTNLADTVAAQTGTLTGDLYVSGGLIEVCVNATAKHYGTFYVTGTVDMEGGTYKPGIDGTTSGKNDHWESGNNFWVDAFAGGSATLTPVNPAGAATVANGIWNIIKSRNGTYSGTFATTNLQYAAGPPPKSFTFGTGGTPVNQANLNT